MTDNTPVEPTKAPTSGYAPVEPTKAPAQEVTPDGPVKALTLEDTPVEPTKAPGLGETPVEPAGAPTPRDTPAGRVKALNWSRADALERPGRPRSPERRKSADILLCHNCGWNASDQLHNYYDSHVKCSASVNRGVWMIGEHYVLKERPVLGVEGPAYAGPYAATVQYVRDNTTIPVPSEMRQWGDSQSTFFLMRRLPGESLDYLLPRLSTEKQKQLAAEVVDYLAELRTHTAPQPGAAGGGPVRDTQMSPSRGVHYMTEDVDEWWSRMDAGFKKRSPAWREKLKARYPVTGGPYVLSHGNLDASNILVLDGHVSGIINWEGAGYFPKWWEAVRAAMYVEELHWQAHLIDEIRRRFGRFVEEWKFCNDCRTNSEFEPKHDFCFPDIPDFCDCKSYGKLSYGPKPKTDSNPSEE